ncbi:MAG: hypothetical protein JWM93_729 [Frankiales bacterium]|nr:hypothetical protein [Frankiales bacterium]
MSAPRTCPTCGYARTYTSEAIADTHHPRHSCDKQTQRANRPADRAERVVRDCEHPNATHQHGTRVAYVRDRCRCVPCSEANRLEEAKRVKAIAFGRGAAYVDATGARQHVLALVAAGVGIKRIASLSGVAHSSIYKIAYGQPANGRPPTATIRPETERAILAIALEAVEVAGGSVVSAVGTRRRIQALATNGWPGAQLAARLGRTRQSLSRVLTADAVTAATARAVADLYEELWDTAPPAQTHAQRVANTKARNIAARAGWLPPLAWDDIDTDQDPAQTATPSTQPARGRRSIVAAAQGQGVAADQVPPDADIDMIAVELAMRGQLPRDVSLNAAEQREVVNRLTDEGASAQHIAELLHVDVRTVSRRRAARRAAA